MVCFAGNIAGGNGGYFYKPPSFLRKNKNVKSVFSLNFQNTQHKNQFFSVSNG